MLVSHLGVLLGCFMLLRHRVIPGRSVVSTQDKANTELRAFESLGCEGLEFRIYKYQKLELIFLFLGTELHKLQAPKILVHSTKK